MMIIIFDNETTGLLLPSRVPVEKQPRVIEFAALLVEGDEVIEEYQTLINPELPLPAIITKITGLTDADLVEAPKFAEVHQTIGLLLNKADVAVAHNLDFDFNMLNNEVKRGQLRPFPWPERRICTVQAYEHLKGKWLKQGELYEHFMKKPQAKAHRALDDVRALHECLVAANFFHEVVA